MEPESELGRMAADLPKAHIEKNSKVAFAANVRAFTRYPKDKANCTSLSKYVWSPSRLLYWIIHSACGLRLACCAGSFILRVSPSRLLWFVDRAFYRRVAGESDVYYPSYLHLYHLLYSPSRIAEFERIIDILSKLPVDAMARNGKSNRLRSYSRFTVLVLIIARGCARTAKQCKPAHWFQLDASIVHLGGWKVVPKAWITAARARELMVMPINGAAQTLRLTEYRGSKEVKTTEEKMKADL
jgi:hypothetical protein